MAAIVNERDLILQGSATRILSSSLAPNIVVPGLRSLILTGPTNVIKIDSGGNPTPLEVLLTATLKAITGDVTWSIISGTATLTGTGNSRTLTYGNMHSDYVTVRASLTFEGVTYTSEFSVTKVRDGASASAGPRGMLYLYGTAETWSNTVADQVILNATGSFTKVLGDHVTLRNVAQTWSETRYWSGFEWVSPGQIINGNMLITGTLSASKIYGGVLSGIAMRIGNGNTINGYAFEISGGGVVEVTSMYGGFFKGTNNFNTQDSAVQGAISSTPTTNGFHVFGVHGLVMSHINSTLAHGIRGQNMAYGTSGIIGTASIFDFYADGGGTNYGPFTGAHDALVARNIANYDIGDIVVDSRKVAVRNVSNTLFVVELSRRANQPAAIGVVASLPRELDEGLVPSALVGGVDKVEDVGPDGRLHARWKNIPVPKMAQLAVNHKLISINAVGEGQVNVCNEGGNIEAGDLIVCSSRRGKGMKQSDDIIRSYTVARAREACTFTSPGEVKMIACIYLCG